MDVKCPKCSIEYEFDEEKITESGVTVKCSSCGHIFKVRKTRLNPQGNEQRKAEREWTVKRKDGRKIHFKELTTLQKWIVEQKVAREDLISKTGQSWKSLGEIAELDSFFQVVDAANRAKNFSNPNQSPHHVTSPTGYAAQAELKEALQPSQQATSMAINGLQGISEGQATNKTAAQNAGSPQSQLNGFPNETLAGELSALDINDPVMQWQKRSRAKRIVIGALTASILGIGVLYVQQPQTFEPVLAVLGVSNQHTDSEETSALGKTLESIRKDSLKELTASMTALETALLDDASNAEQHLAMAHLSVNQSRILSEQHRLFVQSNGPQDQRARLLSSVENANNKAEGHIAKALALKPDDTDAKALQTLLKKKAGDLAALLKKPLAHPQGSMEEEVHKLTVLMHVQAQLSQSSPASAASINDLIGPLEPRTSQDQRFQYLKLSLQVMNAASLSKTEQTQLKGALEAYGQQFDAKQRTDQLLLLLNASPSSANKSVAQKGSSKKATGETASASKTSSKAARAGDYQRMLKRADRARISDRSKLALTLYQQATALNPSASAPYVGMGWANLDVGRSSKAVSSFQKALKKNRQNAEAQFGLGEALRATGRKSAALQAFKRYLDIAPTGPDAADARRAVEQLGR